MDRNKKKNPPVKKTEENEGNPQKKDQCYK